ncbi:unnamed protein product, partial [Discosporangium mesarthrocarpum]
PSLQLQPDVVSYTSAIHACSGPNGNWEKAYYQLLDKMWQVTGARPNKVSYDLVMQACGHGGEWELGVALLEDMREVGATPDLQSFNIAVSACARCGEWKEAFLLVGLMRRAGVVPDAFTYSALIHG